MVALQPESDTLRWAIRSRLEFVEFRLYWDGTVNRSDLMSRFDISQNQASSDLTRYQELAPGNVTYDKSSKCYRPAPAFAPRFLAPDADAYLAQLRLAADGIVGAALPQGLVFDAVPTPRRVVAADILRRVVDAMRSGLALEVLYQSMSAPEPAARRFAPHALAFDGFRWHARAWCYRRAEFRDFVLGRIAAVTAAIPADRPLPDDTDWHRHLVLEVVPHRRLSAGQRVAIERDYGMVNGRLLLTVRAALVDYAKRRLGLDIDPDHRPPEKQHIELRSVSELPPEQPRGGPAIADRADVSGA